MFVFVLLLLFCFHPTVTAHHPEKRTHRNDSVGIETPQGVTTCTKLTGSLGNRDAKDYDALLNY